MIGVTAWLIPRELNSLCSNEKNIVILVILTAGNESCVILPDPFQEERLKSESGSVLTLNSMDDCDSD